MLAIYSTISEYLEQNNKDAFRHNNLRPQFGRRYADDRRYCAWELSLVSETIHAKIGLKKPCHDQKQSTLVCGAFESPLKQKQ